MQSELKTRKARKTQAKLLEAAKATFTIKGFNKTTVDDIAKAAGIGYGTFYLYFEDKKDIFYALLNQVEDELYTAADGGSDLSKDYPKGRVAYRALRKDLKAIFYSFYRNAEFLKFARELALTDLEFNQRYLATRSRLIKRTEQILKKSGLKNINLTIAGIAISGMIESAATELSENCKANFSETLSTITKIYFKIVS